MPNVDRRYFVAGAVLLPDALLHAQQGITHVDTVQTGPPLKSSVITAATLPETGDSPGAKAKTHFNGPTAQLAALASGLVTLEPGAIPHPPHQHPEEEIVIIAQGTGEIVVAGVTAEVGPGDMMYAEANVLHGIKNTGSTMMTFYFSKMLGKTHA